ncbi:MAG: hypothetical protein KAH25_03180 [Bacteroidales bacterium]|nr:hypothetical protein [Bacteroidales bacterium]
MKKIKLLLIILLAPVLLFAQGIEIVPFTGYQFGGKIEYYEGKMKIYDGQNYGVSMFVPMQANIDLELNYTRMGSKMTFSPYHFGSDYLYRESSVFTNYFQIGALKKLELPNEKIIPFGSFSLGATWFETKDFGDKWMFSVALGGGLKIMLTEKIGIVGRGRLLMPMQFGGIGFYAGTGGSGMSANSYVAPLQGDFNIGLLLKLGN